MILGTRIQNDFQLISSYLRWYKTSIYLQSHTCVSHVQDVQLA